MKIGDSVVKKTLTQRCKEVKDAKFLSADHLLGQRFGPSTTRKNLCAFAFFALSFLAFLSYCDWRLGNL
jgi:hypothetical protein